MFDHSASETRPRPMRDDYDAVTEDDEQPIAPRKKSLTITKFGTCLQRYRDQKATTSRAANVEAFELSLHDRILQGTGAPPSAAMAAIIEQIGSATSDMLHCVYVRTDLHKRRSVKNWDRELKREQNLKVKLEKEFQQLNRLILDRVSRGSAANGCCPPMEGVVVHRNAGNDEFASQPPQFDTATAKLQ